MKENKRGHNRDIQKERKHEREKRERNRTRDRQSIILDIISVLYSGKLQSSFQNKKHQTLLINHFWHDITMIIYKLSIKHSNSHTKDIDMHTYHTP